MSFLRRILTGSRETDHGRPGYYVEADGLLVYRSVQGGPLVPVGGGGGSVSAPLDLTGTDDINNGENPGSMDLVNLFDKDSNPVLSIGSRNSPTMWIVVDPAYSQDAIAITDSSNPTGTNFGIDGFGYMAAQGADFEGDNSQSTVLKVAGTVGQPYDLFQVRAGGGPLFRIMGDGSLFADLANLQADNDAGTASLNAATTMLSPAANQVPLTVSPHPGQTAALLVVGSPGGGTCLEVRADGSVHIKTGTSIVADL